MRVTSAGTGVVSGVHPRSPVFAGPQGFELEYHPGVGNVATGLPTLAHGISAEELRVQTATSICFTIAQNAV